MTDRAAWSARVRAGLRFFLIALVAQLLSAIALWGTFAPGAPATPVCSVFPVQRPVVKNFAANAISCFISTACATISV